MAADPPVPGEDQKLVAAVREWQTASAAFADVPDKASADTFREAAMRTNLAAEAVRRFDLAAVEEEVATLRAALAQYQEEKEKDKNMEDASMHPTHTETREVNELPVTDTGKPWSDHLLTAAPDLLAALKAMRGAIQRCDCDVSSGCVDAGFRAMADAAIAKAEGR